MYMIGFRSYLVPVALNITICKEIFANHTPFPHFEPWKCTLYPVSNAFSKYIFGRCAPPLKLKTNEGDSDEECSITLTVEL